MDTERNRYKAKFINITKKNVFALGKAKQVFQNGLNEKI